MIRNRFMSNGKLFANSFLTLCFAIVSCRIGNLSRTVSCRGEAPPSHAGQETIREQFPTAMLCHRFMSNGKLFANSFLTLCFAIVSCRIGNLSQIVSCRDETLLSHAGWETIRQQFPVAMVRNRFTSDGKLFANSFLPLCFAIVSRRIGNLSQTVSCRYALPSFHVG